MPDIFLIFSTCLTLDNTDIEEALADVSPGANADHANMNEAVIPENLDQGLFFFFLTFLQFYQEQFNNSIFLRQIVSAQFGAPWLESQGESSSNPRPATRNSRPNVGIQVSFFSVQIWISLNHIILILCASEQRERTANMTIADLVPYFHLKAEEASQQLNICPTTLKILCRKLKLGRWPFRKVRKY